MRAKRCRCCISRRINKTTPILLSKLFTTCPQLEGLRPKMVKQFRSSDLLFSIAFVMHLFFFENAGAASKQYFTFKNVFVGTSNQKLRYNLTSSHVLTLNEIGIQKKHWIKPLENNTGLHQKWNFRKPFSTSTHFYTPWKHRKPLIFDVLKGCRSVTVKNEIVKFLLVTLLKRTLRIINFCHKS